MRIPNPSPELIAAAEALGMHCFGHITEVEVAPAPATIPSAYVIEEIMAHLGAALMQVTFKDDPIIIGHVKAAHALAKALARAK